jgi:hypothetical protein
MVHGHVRYCRRPRPRRPAADDPAAAPDTHPATAGGAVPMTVPPWPASSTSCAAGSPGGCCRPGSWVVAARSAAGGGCATGSAPGCGGSTRCCWTSSAGRVGSTGRRPAWLRSACAPSGGGLTEGEPDRPRQARVQGPPAGRPSRHSPGRRPAGGQHRRPGAAGSARGRGPSGQGSARSAGSAAQAPLPGRTATTATTTRAAGGRSGDGDHAQDRPAWRRAGPAAWPPPVGGGAVAGLAGGVPAVAGPLRAARRRPARVPPAGLRAGLLTSLGRPRA